MLTSLLALVLVFAGGMARAGSFDFPNFDAHSGLIFMGYAGIHGSILRVSPAIAGAGIGGVWLPEKQPVQDGFQSTFQIQITEKRNTGADGLAFVIQNDPVPVLGQAGYNLGYGGISNVFVVNFDNYHWPAHATAAEGYDEIAVQAAVSPAIPLLNLATNNLAMVHQGVVYSDGAVHTVKVAYSPGILQVYLDHHTNPLISLNVDLARVMDLDAGRAWVGFTAASGADWQNNDIVRWSFDSTAAAPVPVTTPKMTRIYLGSNAPDNASATMTLPRDRAFGYTIPPDVHLTQPIETSTNLIDWVPLTNASYYFRDMDSTNFSRRFYRFPKD